MAIRLSGMNSGLDTDSIVTALVSGYKTKKEKYEKAQTKLSWKQDAWKSLNTKVYSLYSNISNLRFSSAYSLKKTTVSDSTKATVKASSTAPNGTQRLRITNTAKSGSLTGQEVNAKSESTTLAQLGYTGGDAKINVNIGNETKTVTINATSTISDVVNQFKSAGLNASFDTNYKRFYISSKETGVDNDFTLTGANADGADALYRMGIAVGSDISKQYGKYDSLYGDGTQSTQEKIEAARTAYINATADSAKYNEESSNLLNAIKYGSAYSDVQAFYDSLSGTKTESGATIDTAKLEALAKIGNKSAAIVAKNSDGTYTAYTKTTSTDKNGNAIYQSEDGAYISVEERYTKDGVTYKKNEDGSYVDVNNADNKYEGDTADLTKQYTYRTAGEDVHYVSKDADGKETEYTYNEADKTFSKDGVTYSKRADGKYYASTEPEDSTNGITIDKKVEYVSQGAALSSVDQATEAYEDITKNIDKDDLNTYLSTLSTVVGFESTKDTAIDDSDPYSVASLTSAIKDAYANGGADGVKKLIAGNGTPANSYASVVGDLTKAAEEADKTAKDNSIVKDLAAIEDTSSEEYQKALANFVETVNTAHDLKSTTLVNSEANKVDGEDAEIYLNDVKYTGSSNSFTINGLTISALATTGDDEVSITTSTDAQGIYDKIKDFLTEYNNIINEMTKLYNADSAKGYEPLTDDEKDEMSDSEVEKWETKIKDSLLKNDTTLNGVMNAMQMAMMSSVEIDGKKYSLSSFGIHTLGYLNSADNEQNAYHIDGDEDDTNTSGNADKLLTMINQDPDTVMQFMQQLTSNLYSAVGDKMASTSLSSAFTIYNDKQMQTEYNNYTTLIKQWETKLSDKEEYYYKKFTQMETALSKLNSTQSSLSGYFS